MANLDWSQCPEVESVPGRRSGAWVFKDTRMPVSTVFEILEVGSSIEEIIEHYDVTREQIQAVLDFANRKISLVVLGQSPLGACGAHLEAIVAAVNEAALGSSCRAGIYQLHIKLLQGYVALFGIIPANDHRSGGGAAGRARLTGRN